MTTSRSRTLVSSRLGQAISRRGTTSPTDFWAGFNGLVNTLLDAPEEQQPELVNRHFPGILQRFDWQLPNAIDMADTASIPQLIGIGKRRFADGMDWGKILS